MFVRVFRNKEQKEILFNTDNIWKIEVKYGVQSGEMLYRTTLEDAKTNFDAVRVYWIHVGTDVIALPANPVSKVTKVIEDIYNKALKDG